MKIWTQSPVLIGVFVLLPTGEEESSLWLFAGQDGLFQPVNISLSHIKTALRFSPSKCIVSSVLHPLLFIAVHFQWENEKELFRRKIPQVFYTDAVVYHRGSSSKHYPYIQKQASKRPQPNPCALDVNVLNDENMYITLFLTFLETFLSSLVADFAAYEKFLLVNYLYIFIYKKKWELNSRGGKDQKDKWWGRDSVMADTKIHNNNIQSRDKVGARSCSWVHMWAKQSDNEQEGHLRQVTSTDLRRERDGEAG